MSTNSNTDRLIVIEGLDGSGKATQATLLAESLTAAGTPVRRISFPDYAAAKGMRILSSPVGEDERIISGESGASAFGCVSEILLNPSLKALRDQLGLDENSRLLFISTEGATDRENYRAIVWDGKFESFGK